MSIFVARLLGNSVCSTYNLVLADLFALKQSKPCIRHGFLNKSMAVTLDSYLIFILAHLSFIEKSYKGVRCEICMLSHCPPTSFIIRLLYKADVCTILSKMVIIGSHNGSKACWGFSTLIHHQWTVYYTVVTSLSHLLCIVNYRCDIHGLDGRPEWVV